MALTRVCSLDEVPTGKALKADPAGQPALVAKAEGAVRACSRVCMHRGGDLSAGELDGAVITCPLHFWKYSVVTGACVQVPQIILRTYPVKVENNEVFVDA